MGREPLLVESSGEGGLGTTSVVSSEYQSKQVVWADAQRQPPRDPLSLSSSSHPELKEAGMVDVVSDAVSSISDDQKPKKREESDEEDHHSSAVPAFTEPWTKDVRRWCIATLTPNSGGEQAKIHIAMLRREFLLAAREKPYFNELSGPLNRPRSRDSRTFLAALLHVVGVHAKQSQCVINGVNQIGIVGYSYKRPTVEDYARAAKRDLFSNNGGDYFSNEQAAGGNQSMFPYYPQPHQLKRPRFDDAAPSPGSSSLDPSWRFLQAGAPVPAGALSPPSVRLEAAPPGIKLDGGSVDFKDEFDQPRHTPQWTDPQQLPSEDSARTAHPPLDDAPPVKLQFAVRMFKYGARHQLAVYRLASLRNSPHACEAVLPQNMTHLLDEFRPNDWHPTGFDAVALGLLSLGQTEPPIPYAIRTFSIVDGETVRVSNPATDMRLPEYLDFDNILKVFDSQIAHLAQKLMPSTRFLTVETHRGSKNHVAYTERGLPIVDSETGQLRGTIFFQEWAPPVEYASKFPRSNGAATDDDADVVYLRVELHRVLAVPTTQATNSAPESPNHRQYLAPSPAPPLHHSTSPLSPTAASAHNHIEERRRVSVDGVHQYQPQQQATPQQQQPPPLQAYVSTPHIFPQVPAGSGHLEFGGDESRVLLPSPRDHPTQEQIMQWSNQIGVNQKRTVNEGSAGHMAIPFQHFPRGQVFQPACLSMPTAPLQNLTANGIPQPPLASGAVYGAMNMMAAQRSLYLSQINNNLMAAAQKGAQRILSPPGETTPRGYSRQLKQPQKESMSKRREESPPLWVGEVRRWASKVLKAEPEARIHVCTLRDEFLRSRRDVAEQDPADGCPEESGRIDYEELRHLFSLPKSHESRLFTKTILDVVGVHSKRQQCVIDGVNQCGIVDWKIDYSGCTTPSSAGGSPCPSD